MQRPVFYAIAIIITAYLPIFTLQRVEGRLFRPMAWTVAFALLGAMTFSILIAPVLASVLFREWCSGMAQPGHGLPHRALPAAAALVPWGIAGFTVAVGVGCARGDALFLWLQRNHWLGISAASGRRRDLGARHPREQHQPYRRRAVYDQRALCLRVLSGSEQPSSPRLAGPMTEPTPVDSATQNISSI